MKITCAVCGVQVTDANGALTLVPLAFEEALERWPRAQRWRSTALAVFTVLLLSSFVFYSPLTFHRPLTHVQRTLRNMFQQVVDCRP